MHDTALGGASQSARAPEPLAQSGDVDPDGEIVDALRRRLDEAIGPVVDIAREDHLERVLLVCARAKARRP